MGAGFTGQPASWATTAAAATLAWLLAMCALLGMAGATWMLSPMTWMPAATSDSKLW